MGLICGCIYLAVMFMFIPFPFMPYFSKSAFYGQNNNLLLSFPHDLLGQYLAGLLSLFSMLFLGFVDDVLDIRWRVKIWMPLLASIPLLTVYYVTYNGTHIVVPSHLRSWVGSAIIDLG